MDEPTPALPTRPRLPLVVLALGAAAALLGIGWWTQSGDAPEPENARPELAATRPEPRPSPNETLEVAAESPSEPVADVSQGQVEALPTPEAAPPEPTATPARPRARPHASQPAGVAESATAPDADEQVTRSDTLELDPAAARAHHAQGTSALVRGRIPAAIGHFRNATLAAPGYGPAWRGLGLAYERIGRGADARRAFERYLRVAGNAPDADTIRERLARL